MKITQDVRKYAEDHKLSETDALAAGMHEKAEEFRAAGGRVYLPVTSADR